METTTAHTTTITTTSHSPIILINGLPTSVLEGKVNRTTTRYPYCRKSTNDQWETLWLSFRHLFPPHQNCLFDELALHYNKDGDTWSNTQGVEIRTVDFGGVSGLSHIDPETRIVLNYQGMIDYLTKSMGYCVGQDLFGAPYGKRRRMKK